MSFQCITWEWQWEWDEMELNAWEWEGERLPDVSYLSVS